MHKLTIIATGLLLLMLGILFTCTLPTPPPGADAAKVGLYLKSSSGMSGTSITDSVGNIVSIGVILSLTQYIDSTIITVQFADLLEKTFKTTSKKVVIDTVFFPVSFATAGIRAVTATGYISSSGTPYPNSEDTASITIVGATPPAVNHQPVLTVPHTKLVVAGETLILHVTASDPDLGQTTTITATKKPSNASFSNDTLRWPTTLADVGIDTVIFVATDNGSPALSTTDTVFVTVGATSVNRPPEWSTKQLPRSAQPGETVTLTLASWCTDPDNEKVTYTLQAGEPAGDTIIDDIWSFSPTETDTGVYTVHLIAADSSGATDTLAIMLTISREVSGEDTTGPTITRVDGPASGAVVDNQEVTIIDSIVDSGNIDSTYWTINNGVKKLLSLVPGSTSRYALTDTLSSGKPDTLRVTAVDGSIRHNRTVQTIILTFSTSAQTFTVTYSGNGNSSGSVPTDTNAYPAGATVTVKANTGKLMKTGATFTDWNTTADGSGENRATGSSFVMEAADDTIYALWTMIDYTITYNLGGGTNSSSNPASYTTNTPAIALANPTKAGFIFAGWFDNAALTGTAVNSMPAGSMGDKAFWAKWTSAGYTITYTLNGGTNNAGNPASYDVTSAAITLATPNKAGNSFGGWFDNAGLTGTAVTSIPAGSTGDKTFWAKWNVTMFTITYTLNGGTNNAGNSASYDVTSAAITLATPTKAGNSFGGWFDNAGLTGTAVTSIPAESTGDKTFWAKWNVTMFTITYTLNGGTNNAGNPALYDVTSAAITLATPNKTGNSFGGWFDNAGLTGTAVTSIPAGSTGNKVFWAKWTPINYSITFNNNDPAATGTMANQSIASGSSANLKANSYSKPCATFAGWATSSTGTVVFDNQASYAMGVVDVTLWAKWTPLTPPSIAISPASASICSGQTQTFTATASGGSGYTYAWTYNSSPVGTNSATLTGRSAAGTYACKITTSAGCSSGAVATLTVNALPTITKQPVSQSYCVTGNGLSDFFVTANGVKYQWKKDGAILTDDNAKYTGTKTNKISVYNLAANAGDYTCDVSNSDGCTVTSAPAHFTKNKLEVSNPTNLALCEGETGSFSVSSTCGTSFEWYQISSDGAEYPVTSGETGEMFGYFGTKTSTLTINPYTNSLHPADYYCKVSDGASTVRSESATLSTKLSCP